MKHIYIVSFVILGILMQFLFHAGIEIWYIDLLVNNFETYGLGLTWAQWLFIHDIATIVLFIAGGVLGYAQGQHWWKQIYEKSPRAKAHI